MEERERTEATMPEPDRTYSPALVRRWLDNWDQLNELAMLTPPSTSRFRELTIRAKGPMPRDAMRYLHTLADLEVAFANLPPDSLEYWAVHAVIHGETFRQAEHDLRKRHGSLAGAYGKACRQMAEILGWRECAEVLTRDSNTPTLDHDLEPSSEPSN
jgi:hypothetical protein